MSTDQPAHKLSPQQTPFAQDLIAPQGIARMRKGWSFDGTTADVADNLVGVYRNKFLLADVTRTVTGDDDGDLFVHNASAAGTALFTGSVQYLPRCVYRDELIWCAQDGLTPLRRYSGAASAGTASDLVGGTSEGEATVTGITFSTPPDVGGYVMGNSWRGGSRRILVAATTSLTLEDFREQSVGGTGTTITVAQTGTAASMVGIYNAGTVTSATTTLTGYGTNWVDDLTLLTDSVEGDAVLLMPVDGSGPYFADIGSVSTNTSLDFDTSLGTLSTKMPYQILRRCPFRDAAAHNGSFWGTGVAQYPNRVYVGPPGLVLCNLPGFTSPTSRLFAGSTNPNDFLLDFVDVPTAYEGDVNVAILSTPNPLLVLKRSAVYGVYGAFPNFSVDKVADGVGCIDLRSAISGPNGQFWAGEDGIYAYAGGQVVDLTEGKIGREWASLIGDFDYGTSDYCAIGESNGHLIVSLVTGAGTTARTYVYDLRAQGWMSRFTNHKARYFFSSKVDGEASELYWVGDNDQGRVMKSSGVFDGTGTAKDGDGDSPRMQAWSPEGIDGSETIDNDARLLDLAIAHNVYDAGAAGSTQLAVSVVYGGSLEANASATKTLDDISSDTVDRVDRTRYRTVNTKGRVQQVRLDVDTLGTNTAATKVEVHEIIGTIRDRRART